MSAPKTPSNAVKHGLTSRFFVPEFARALVEEIRLDLTAMHKPETSEEKEIISELAVALWQNAEHDRRYYERLAYEEAIANDVFDRQAREKFQEELSQLKDRPWLNGSTLAESYFGCLHLQATFAGSLATLCEHLPLSFRQITDCINAAGEDWRLDSWSDQARRQMACHLALVADPESEIILWVARSEPAIPADADHRARHCHANAPETEKARHELIDLFTAKLETVNKRIDTLRARYEKNRDLFKAAGAGYGLGDPAVSKAALLALRYQTAASNRCNRLYKALDRLKDERCRVSTASLYSYCRPAPPTPEIKPHLDQEYHFANFSLTPATQELSPAEALKPPLRNKTRIDSAEPLFKPLTTVRSGERNPLAKTSRLESARAHLARLLNQAG